MLEIRHHRVIYFLDGMPILTTNIIPNMSDDNEVEIDGKLYAIYAICHVFNTKTPEYVIKISLMDGLAA